MLLKYNKLFLNFQKMDIIYIDEYDIINNL